ncbi:MAG: hypothetical protein Q7S92_02035 [Candidatus Diapherotrites archaeon]|nr:hypothetical protein [Candidatus Diapherotrites archaeon]
MDYNSGYFVSSSMNQFFPISNAFKNLPIPPKDFFKHTQLFSKEYGSAVNLLPKYYRQPEFLPNFYENFFVHYQTFNPTHFFIQGLGVLPFEQFISLKKGERKRIALFWHTAFGVQSFQGIRIQTQFPEQSFTLQNYLYNSQDSAKVSNYFSIALTPSEFLLGPAYPFFDPAWNQKVIAEIEALPDSLPGNYVVAFEITSPSLENESIWSNQKTNYVSGSDLAQSNFPRARLNIRIEP